MLYEATDCPDSGAQEQRGIKGLAPHNRRSKRMRVVVLMAISSPWSRRVATNLSAIGADVHVVDFAPGAGLEYLSSSDEADARAELLGRVEGVHEIANSRRYLLRVAKAARQLRRLASESSTDVVLTLYGGASALIAYLSGVRPYVVYVVGSDVLLANRFRRAVSRLTLTSAAAVLANGQHLARATRLAAPQARVRNLYLGVDAEALRGSRRDRKRSSFVCNRVFRPVYDNATIVRAIAELRDPPEEFSVSFLSAGPLLEPTIELADRILRSSVRDRVSFAGWTSEEELVDTFQSSSFYVSASLSDGTSSSLLEALAAGLLPIVSDIPANRDWVTHGRNGLLFPPGDHQALATCMERAMAGEPWMASAADANYELVVERASIEATMETLFEVLESVAEEKGAG